jgi:hypothetical protein
VHLCDAAELGSPLWLPRGVKSESGSNRFCALQMLSIEEHSRLVLSQIHPNSEKDQRSWLE